MTVFKNSYLIMRHGESVANAKGVIVSDPAIGCKDFGLTQQGSEQVVASVLAHTGEAITKIICSDFLRARQTAELIAQSLNLPSPQQDTGLRERFFGSWEGKSDEHLQGIYQRDEITEKQVDDGVESTEAILQRGIKVLERLEHRHQGHVILLVSHGDILQILRTAFVGKPPRQHRSLPHHETGEIRWLVSQGDEYLFHNEQATVVA
jgi:probable phosphoglycerate mutase